MDRIIIIDEKNLEALKTEIADAVIKGLKSIDLPGNNHQTHQEWIDDTEAKQILGYRSKTKMQELRNSSSIVFSKFGRKIKYNRQSLMDYIEHNKKPNLDGYGN